MITYYIASPPLVYTGGPTLAHQMCRELIDQGCRARMFYYDGYGRCYDWEDVGETEYGKYHLEYAKSMDEIDRADSVVLFPETAWQLHVLFHDAVVYIWWMSVDNYLSNKGKVPEQEWKAGQAFFKRENAMHFVQSKYARDFCTGSLSIPEDHVFYLTDFIDERFLERKKVVPLRKDIVFYNKRKLSEEGKALMEQFPGFRWFPIADMTPEQVIHAFSSGKVYVDFGRHPGKDRMPREAASQGCLIITNREGAAGNAEDIPIPDKYKFDDAKHHLPEIANQIELFLKDYESYLGEFAKYRRQIRKEKQKFQAEVTGFISLTS